MVISKNRGSGWGELIFRARSSCTCHFTDNYINPFPPILKKNKRSFVLLMWLKTHPALVCLQTWCNYNCISIKTHKNLCPLFPIFYPGHCASCQHWDSEKERALVRKAICSWRTTRAVVSKAGRINLLAFLSSSQN